MRTQQGLRVPNCEHRFEGEPKIGTSAPVLLFAPIRRSLV
jgi:hypothetical protein